MAKIRQDPTTFDNVNQIYSRQLLLPSSKVRGTQVQRGIIADGCIITDAHIERSVIGIRRVIESGTPIRNSVLMGAGFYQAEAWGTKAGRSTTWHRTPLPH